MKQYILLKVFHSFKSDSGEIRWTGKLGIVGVIPVFNSLQMLKRMYPNEEYIEIEIT